MWKFATASEIGGRSEQQDRVAVFACEDTDEVLAVLADGMGGHSGGAVAAQICIETARAAWERV